MHSERKKNKQEQKKRRRGATSGHNTVRKVD